MSLTLVGDDRDPAEQMVIADLARAAGLASVGRISERIGLSPARAESVLLGLIRKGRVRTCRYVDGVFYELIPDQP